jgi:hypothetical protein
MAHVVDDGWGVKLQEREEYRRAQKRYVLQDECAQDACLQKYKTAGLYGWVQKRTCSSTKRELADLV